MQRGLSAIAEHLVCFTRWCRDIIQVSMLGICFLIILSLLQLWLALSTDLPNLTLRCSAVLICCLICILGHLLVQFCILPLCPVDTFAALLYCYVTFCFFCITNIFYLIWTRTFVKKLRSVHRKNIYVGWCFILWACTGQVGKIDKFPDKSVRITCRRRQQRRHEL